MHRIVVSNRKGGTGKTTVAVNIAAELAARGRRVLLVDLDSQGHCAVGLGVTVKPNQPTAHRLFTDPKATLASAIVATEYANLWLVPADTRFDYGIGEHQRLRLRMALDAEDLAQDFDCILIDTPPSLDTLLFNALLAANRLLIPYVPHHLSFEGIRQLMRALFPIMAHQNRALKILGLVPNMATNRVRQHRIVTTNIGHEFGVTRRLPEIRSDIRLTESFVVGKPIRHYAPKSRAAEDFAHLAEEVARRLEG